MTDKESIGKSTVSKREWQKIVSAWQAKDATETTTHFCKTRGINEPQFYYWKNRYLAKSEAKPTWSAVKIKTPLLPSSAIKIHVANKLTIELSSQVDADFLSRLFSALGVG